MPRQRDAEGKSCRCPDCGATVQPAKTWQLVSPLPDSQGRITITVMGSFECPNCGHRWRGVVTKMKVGEDVEIEGVKKGLAIKSEGGRPRQSTVIELDIDKIMHEEEE